MSASHLQLPFDHLDKACFAATSARHGLSNAPTWALSIEGTVDGEALRRAVAALLVAFPSCGAMVVPIDAADSRAKRWAWRLPKPAARPEDVDAALIDAIVTVHPPLDAPPLNAPLGTGAVADALGDGIRDRFLDLTLGPPLRVDLLCWPGGARLWLQQHHGLADGRAFIELLRRFGRLLDVAARGDAFDAGDLIGWPRRPELEAIDALIAARSGSTALAPLWRRRWWACLGLWRYVQGAFAALVRPTAPLWQNQSLDYSGANRTVHLALPLAQVEALRVAAAAAGGNLHAALLAAWVRASAALSAQHGVVARRLMLSSIVELRPRGGGGDAGAFESFANHLGWALPTVDAAAMASMPRLVAALHRGLKRQMARGEPIQRLLFERLGLAALALGPLREGLAAPGRAVVQLNVSNVLALPIERIAGRDFTVTAVRITTPVSPRYGALLTITRYDDEVTLNVNVKRSVVGAQDAAILAKLLQDELGAFAAG